MKYVSLFALLLLSVAFSSCRERQPDIFADVKGTYFSVKQMAIDEWNTHAADPVTFIRRETVNGKTDSSYQSIEHVDWPAILKVFFETDISDRKFLGKYKFSQFDDNVDNTHDFMYIAADKDLYTQQLLITMAIGSNKVTGIYIETEKNNLLGEVHQKLYYNPMKTIQIQRTEKPLIGRKKETLIQYDVK